MKKIRTKIWRKILVDWCAKQQVNVRVGVHERANLILVCAPPALHTLVIVTVAIPRHGLWGRWGGERSDGVYYHLRVGKARDPRCVAISTLLSRDLHRPECTNDNHYDYDNESHYAETFVLGEL